MENVPAINSEIMSSLILKGDMSGLTSNQRVQYVTNLCQRLGLDPLTQPFKILKLQGREVLYADKGCTQQLCKIYKISTEITKREKIEDIYVITVRATGNDGRFTDDDGAVTIGSSKGDTLANAMMKCVTKAKRRAVLAFCGLGMLDETEVETIKGATIEKIATEPIQTHFDTPEIIAPVEKEISPELQEVMDLGKQFFKKSKLNFVKWLGSTFNTNDPMLLTPEDIIKAKNILTDLINNPKENNDEVL